MQLPNKYFNSHIIALAIAIAMHATIAAFAMQPAEKIIIQQQVMRVTMVAPSSIEQKQEKAEIQIKQEVPLKNKAAHKLKAETKKKHKNDTEKNSNATPPTSGPQDKNSVDKIAAHSEPVYNAAYLNNPAPAYPVVARRKNIQGKVLLEVNVTPEGKAGMVVIASSSGFSMLDEAALHAVQQWSFIPAKQGSELIEAKVIIPVEFKLN